MSGYPSSLPPRWQFWLILPLCAYALILLCTQPYTYVDSLNYAKHIVDHSHHALPAAQDPYWDFGHVAWRQMGHFVWRLLETPLNHVFGGNELFAAAGGLVVLSVLGGFTGTAFLFLLLARLTGKAWVAAVLATGFAGTNAVMNYSLTGTAYMAGAACQIAGLYALHSALLKHALSMKRALAIGLLLGLSICIWFPFVLSMAGLLAYVLIWRGTPEEPDLRNRFRFLLQIAIAIGLIVTLVYGTVMVQRGTTSVDSALQWAARSRYKIAPTRGVARMLFSMPRTFFWLGTDSSVWKRFLLRNPADPVSLAEVARTGIWKVAGVYFILGLLAWKLARTPPGRRALLCLALAAFPLVIFAAFLFDPSPPERYLASFPLLFPALALLFMNDRFSRFAVSLFLAATLLTNVRAMSRFQSDPATVATIVRLQSVNQRFAPNDLILLPSYQDDAYKFIQWQPFHPASRNQFRMYIVIPTGTLRILTWQQELAESVLGAWKQGGRAWVSHRFFSPKPSLDWWVPGDETRIDWADVWAFFQKLDFAGHADGTDTFSELTPSAENQHLLQSVLHGK